MSSSLSKYILFFFLLLEIASVSHGLKLRGVKDKILKKQRRCKREICPQIKCAPDHISVIPDGQCCPVCKPTLDCSAFMCAACAGVALYSEGQCCPKCEAETLVNDCSLMLCAQPVCTEGYEPVKKGCCETCQLKSNCVVVQCITEPCPPVCTTQEAQPLTEVVACPLLECEPGYEPQTPEGERCPTCVATNMEVLGPCMMASCMDPCNTFSSDTGDFVPVCPEQECVTETIYHSGGGDHCPAWGCPEFRGCK
jgi:hypothetical protein